MRVCVCVRGVCVCVCVVCVCVCVRVCIAASFKCSAAPSVARRAC